jgi:hypothetical protein
LPEEAVTGTGTTRHWPFGKIEILYLPNGPWCLPPACFLPDLAIIRTESHRRHPSATPAVRTRPESLPTGSVLAGVGGFLDAYTFVGYGGVFANAQTGNIVLLGVDCQAGHWRAAGVDVPVP